MVKQVVIISGLGDRLTNLKIATFWWKHFGFNMHIIETNWRGKENYLTKVNRIKKEVVKITKSGPTSIVGTSAGGSMAFNIFLDLWPSVNKAINICGRLTHGTETGFRSFESRTKTSPAFAKSVIEFEKRSKKITKDQLKGMLCIRSGIYDELVPDNTSIIQDIKHIEIPLPEHGLCITAALTVFAKKDIFRFLHQ
jgi:hypothetical protein